MTTSAKPANHEPILSTLSRSRRRIAVDLDFSSCSTANTPSTWPCNNTGSLRPASCLLALKQAECNSTGRGDDASANDSNFQKQHAPVLVAGMLANTCESAIPNCYLEGCASVRRSLNRVGKSFPPAASPGTHRQSPHSGTHARSTAASRNTGSRSLLVRECWLIRSSMLLENSVSTQGHVTSNARERYGNRVNTNPHAICLLQLYGPPTNQVNYPPMLATHFRGMQHNMVRRISAQPTGAAQVLQQPLQRDEAPRRDADLACSALLSYPAVPSKDPQRRDPSSVASSTRVSRTNISTLWWGDLLLESCHHRQDVETGTLK